MVEHKPSKTDKKGEAENITGDEETDRQIKVDYKIESIIGKGSFATVRKGKNRQTGERVAIKILSKRKMTPEDIVAMQNEIDIMREVDHPNIVKMLNVYEDKNHYCLVMELMTGGELFDHIIEKETFDEEMAQKIMAPVFDAVIYCHERDIIHRDIKPENLLLSGKNLDDSIIKVSDFGLARYINAGAEELATTTCGTPGYVAPEILNKKPYDHRCDYWSLAVVLFIMLSGTPPFYHEDNFELFEIIKKGQYDYDAPAWKMISTEAKDLITRLLITDPAKRITAEEIRLHPWISGEYKAAKKNLNTLEAMKGWNTRRKLLPDQQEN